MDLPTTLTDVDDGDGVTPTMTKAPTATAPPDSPTTMTDVLDTDSPTTLDVGGDDDGGDDDGGDDDGGDDNGGDDDGVDDDGDGGTPKMTTFPTATATTDPDRCNDSVCPQVYTPVCGSDGETYSNECVFGVAQCEDPSLLSFKEGECPA